MEENKRDRIRSDASAAVNVAEPTQVNANWNKESFYFKTKDKHT